MALTQLETEVGRVLYASTTEYAFGCHVAQARQSAPVFGAVVRADGARADIFGLVYDVRVNDDPLVRQLVVAAGLSEEYIEDQRHNRHVPIELTTLAVGCRPKVVGGGAAQPVRRQLPPQPPMSLDRVFACTDEELVVFTERFDYFGLVLSAAQVPAEELLAAHLRLAAEARPEPQRRAFLVRAGKELARLLTGDLLRLEAVLRSMRG